MSWTLLRALHIAGLAFFVEGQLVLVAAVLPALRRSGGEDATRSLARRFGIGSAIALVVLVGTGIAMASRFASWDSNVLRAKLMLLVLVVVLVALRVASPKSRGISYAMVVASLIVVLLGVELSHG